MGGSQLRAHGTPGAAIELAFEGVEEASPAVHCRAVLLLRPGDRVAAQATVESAWNLPAVGRLGPAARRSAVAVRGLESPAPFASRRLRHRGAEAGDVAGAPGFTFLVAGAAVPLLAPAGGADDPGAAAHLVDAPRSAFQQDRLAFAVVGAAAGAAAVRVAPRRRDVRGRVRRVARRAAAAGRDEARDEGERGEHAKGHRHLDAERRASDRQRLYVNDGARLGFGKR